MKRKTLTTAVLAGLTGVAGMAGVANAVNLNPDGLGQVLLYPYYSAKGGNDTLISVVNTTDQAKSVKIRFIEALNSREVLDFNIYMSQFDVWTAAITATEAGGGKIRITDQTCTVPWFQGGFGGADEVEPGTVDVNFLDFQYVGSNGDGGPTGIDRTTSGYIELIEMGTLTGTSAANATHANDVPADCGALHAAWQAGGYWAGDASIDHDAPSGGLFGGASIINVADGTMFSYTANAIDGFSTTQLHTRPESLSPSLGSGDNNVSNVFINGVVDTQTWPEPIDAVNATLMHDMIMNEFVVGGGANANSEWVITFPTKRFHSDAAPGGPNPGLGAPKPPFTSLWTVDSPGACESMSVQIWNREERGVAPQDLVPSPPPPSGPDFVLCREANVQRFSNDGSTPEVAEITKEAGPDLLGYANFDIPADFTSGWARFDFTGRSSIPAASGDVYVGLPVIGFWVNTFLNGTLDDGNVLANYGGTFNHRGTRAVATGS